jgi:hypothetical protein
MEETAMRYMDPVWDTLDGGRARYVRTLPDGMVELADNDGKVLPDYRHATQVRPYVESAAGEGEYDLDV